MTDTKSKALPHTDNSVKKAANYLLLAFIFIVSLIYRLFLAQDRGLVDHEMWSVHCAQWFSTTDPIFLESNGILYYLLTNIWFYLFGSDYILLRIFSIICWLITLALVYNIGRKIGGVSTGICSALFFSIHDLSVFYSGFIRFYSLGWLFAVLSTWLLLVASENNKTKYWIYYGISSVCAISSMVLTIFILPSHWLYILYVGRVKDTNLDTNADSNKQIKNDNSKVNCTDNKCCSQTKIAIWRVFIFSLLAGASLGGLMLRDPEGRTRFDPSVLNLLGNIRVLLGVYENSDLRLYIVKYITMPSGENLIITYSSLLTAALLCCMIYGIYICLKGMRYQIKPGVLAVMLLIIPLLLHTIVSTTYRDMGNITYWIIYLPFFSVILGTGLSKLPKIGRWTVLACFLLLQQFTIIDYKLNTDLCSSILPLCKEMEKNYQNGDFVVLDQNNYKEFAQYMNHGTIKPINLSNIAQIDEEHGRFTFYNWQDPYQGFDWLDEKTKPVFFPTLYKRAKNSKNIWFLFFRDVGNESAKYKVIKRQLAVKRFASWAHYGKVLSFKSQQNTLYFINLKKNKYQ